MSAAVWTSGVHVELRGEATKGCAGPAGRGATTTIMSSICGFRSCPNRCVRTLRDRGVRVAVLVLSAGLVDFKVQASAHGAVDYVTKTVPRSGAVARSGVGTPAEGDRPPTLKVNGPCWTRGSREVTRDGSVRAQPKEYAGARVSDAASGPLMSRTADHRIRLDYHFDPGPTSSTCHYALRKRFDHRRNQADPTVPAWVTWCGVPCRAFRA